MFWIQICSSFCLIVLCRRWMTSLWPAGLTCMKITDLWHCLRWLTVPKHCLLPVGKNPAVLVSLLLTAGYRQVKGFPTSSHDSLQTVVGRCFSPPLNVAQMTLEPLTNFPRDILFTLLWWDLIFFYITVYGHWSNFEKAELQVWRWLVLFNNYYQQFIYNVDIAFATIITTLPKHVFADIGDCTTV